MNKIETSNIVLGSFTNSRIERRKSGWFVLWDGYRGEQVSRRWQCRGGQDFYPVWHRHWPHGGTASTALSQLIRWNRDQPVLSIHSWRYWAGDVCKLVPPSAVDTLEAGGYPSESICVLCGNRIEGGIDWWNLDGVSGPCCHYSSGCRQKRAA